MSENGLSGAHSRSCRFPSHSVPEVAFSVNIFENSARANTFERYSQVTAILVLSSDVSLEEQIGDIGLPQRHFMHTETEKSASYAGQSNYCMEAKYEKNKARSSAEAVI